MPSLNQFQIVVASPGDVPDERVAVDTVVSELNDTIAPRLGLDLRVRKWETHATPGTHPLGPQFVIDPELKVADCDLFVCIFWSRLGTPVVDAPSGTAHELQNAYEACNRSGKPRIWCYFNEAPFTPDTDEQRAQLASLHGFREAWADRMLRWPYGGAADFERKFRRHLLLHLSSPLPADLDRVRNAYLNHIIRECSTISARGKTRSLSAFDVPLDALYVSLSAERTTERDRAQDEWQDPSRPDPEDRNRDDEPKERDRRKEVVVEEWDVPRAVREAPRMVVLGDPGSGKTTLARSLAVRFAQACLDGADSVRDAEGCEYGPTRLPICVRVADYATERERKPNLAVRTFLGRAFPDLPVPKSDLTRLFDAALNKGKAFVILDGFDEIARPKDRAGVARAIEAFVRGLPAATRVLVTSRVDGYREAPIAIGEKPFTLRDLSPDEIKLFLSQWCAAHAHRDPDGGSEDQCRKRADNAYASLQAQIEVNEGVARLAKNPLLLTLLAVMHQEEPVLPTRRIELYRRASQMLLRDWRASQPAPVPEWLEDGTVDRVLPALAFEIHSRRSAGLIAETEAQALLCGHPDAPRLPATFLRELGLHSGLFLERTLGKYGFLHLTFEEYYAAQHLAALPDHGADWIAKHRHQSRWQEVIRLTVASLGELDAAALIRAGVWCADGAAATTGYVPSAYEDILYRDFFLAARCIGDCVAVEASLARMVGDRLAEMSMGRRRAAVAWGTCEAARQSIAALRATETGAFALNALLVALKGREPAVRYAAAGALGDAGADAADAERALLSGLTDTAWSVRQASARALGSVATGSVPAQTGLLAALTDEHSGVRSAAAAALGTVGAGSPDAVRGLLDALKDRDGTVRWAAGHALGRAGAGSSEAVGGLLDALKDEDSGVRLGAARALGNAGVGCAEAVRDLLGALKDEDRFVRLVAADALGSAGAGSAEAVRGLLGALKDADRGVRRAAADALGSAGAGSAEAVRGLLGALKDADRAVRLAAADALGSAGAGSGEAVRGLLDALKDEDSGVRAAAPQGLSTVGVGWPDAVSGLVQALTDQDKKVRRASAAALGPTVVWSADRVCDLLGAPKDEGPAARWVVVHMLGGIAAAAPEIGRALVGALADPDGSVRWDAAMALGAAGSGSEGVVGALLGTLQDEDPGVRAAGAAALADIGIASQEALDALAAATSEQDYALRDTAYHSLSILVQRMEDERDD